MARRHGGRAGSGRSTRLLSGGGAGRFTPPPRDFRRGPTARRSTTPRACAQRSRHALGERSGVHSVRIRVPEHPGALAEPKVQGSGDRPRRWLRLNHAGLASRIGPRRRRCLSRRRETRHCVLALITAPKLAPRASDAMQRPRAAAAAVDGAKGPFRLAVPHGLRRSRRHYTPGPW